MVQLAGRSAVMGGLGPTRTHSIDSIYSKLAPARMNSMDLELVALHELWVGERCWAIGSGSLCTQLLLDGV